MAITKYIKPITAQYVPMDMNMYAKVKETESSMGQKPWNLIAAMRARQEQMYSTANANIDELNNKITSIKGINENDQILANKKIEEYNAMINDAIKKTGGNPSSLLPYLTSINRRFTRDVQSGDLYNVIQRYNTGLEDIKQAKKDVASGKLSPLGYNLQKKFAGTGIMVPRNGDIDSSAKDMLSKDYANSLFVKNRWTAEKNYLDAMHQKYGMVYNNLSEEEKAAFDTMLDTSFKQYYREKGWMNADGSINRDLLSPVLTQKTSEKNVETSKSPVRKEELVFDENGNIVKIKKESNIFRDILKMSPNFMALNALVEVATGEKTDSPEQKTKIIEEETKKLNLPDNYTIQEKEAIVENAYNNKKELATATFEPPLDTDKVKYDKMSLVDNKGAFKDLTSTDMWVSVDGGGFKKVENGEQNSTVRNLFTDKDLTKLKSAGGSQKMNANIKISSSEEKPLILEYHLTNKNGEDVVIKMSPKNTKLTSLAKPAWEVQKAIDGGNFREKIETSGYSSVDVMDKNGNVIEKPYSYFEIIPVPLTTDREGNKLPAEQVPVTFVVKLYDSKKQPIKQYNQETKRYEDAIVAPNTITDASAQRIVNELRIK